MPRLAEDFPALSESLAPSAAWDGSGRDFFNRPGVSLPLVGKPDDFPGSSYPADAVKLFDMKISFRRLISISTPSRR